MLCWIGFVFASIIVIPTCSSAKGDKKDKKVKALVKKGLKVNDVAFTNSSSSKTAKKQNKKVVVKKTHLEEKQEKHVMCGTAVKARVETEALKDIKVASLVLSQTHFGTPLELNSVTCADPSTFKVALDKTQCTGSPEKINDKKVVGKKI
uniref:ZP domain-containing protein n=1 Tax=Rhabditophanes sp. KR3021 TaxID=114890 RepID=A0AC35TL20_9BILA